MRIKHIFFDLDHTLWDFERNAAACIAQIFQDLNIALPTNCSLNDFIEVFSSINQQLWNLLDQDKISIEYLRKERFRAVGEHFSWEIDENLSLQMNDLFLQYLPNQSTLIDNAIPVLEQLSLEFNLHIISNGYLAIQTKKLKSSGIFHFFDKIITYDVANARKPDAAIFHYALQICDADSQSAIMIGDNAIADVLGAKNAGLKVIHFDESGLSTEKFACTTLSQVPSLISEMSVLGG